MIGKGVRHMTENRFGDEVLPIGTKNGCLTIIGGFEEYEKIKDAEAAENIIEYTRQIEVFQRTGTIAPHRDGDGHLLFSGFVDRENRCLVRWGNTQQNSPRSSETGRGNRWDRNAWPYGKKYRRSVR